MQPAVLGRGVLVVRKVFLAGVLQARYPLPPRASSKTEFVETTKLHETTKSCTHLGRMVCAFVLLTAQAHALLLSPQARLSSGSRRSPSPVLRAVPPAGFQWGEADRERTADRTLRQLDGTLLNRAVRLGNHVPAFASLTYFGLISMTMQNMRLMPDMAATLRAVITRSVLACQPARLSRLR